MNTESVNTYIQNLIRQGEHQRLDFKFCITDSKKIARTLVAFSNTDGGKILIGVKDNGIIAGIKSEEEFYMVQAAAHLYCRPSIHFKYKNWNISNKNILEIITPKSENILYYALNDRDKWRVYIRVKDQNLLANRVFIRAWKREKKNIGTFIQYTDKEKLLLNHLKKSGVMSLSKFQRTAKISRYKAESILVNLLVLKIININFTDKGVYYTLR
jgi:predicted HTH transcriptional regulator